MYKRILSSLLVPGLLVAAPLGFGIGAFAVQANAKELIFDSYAPRRSPVYTVLFEGFAKKIEADTNGELTIKIPSATLAPAERHYQMVIEGGADVVNISRYSVRDRWKTLKLAELPFNAPTVEAASVAMWETHKKFFAETNEYEGLKLLTTVSLIGRVFETFKKPLNSIADLEGLKIWANAGIQEEAAKAVNAVPVAVPFPKLFEFASKGTIDGVLASPGTLLSSGIGDLAKYEYAVPGGVGATAFGLVMNENSWNGLTDEQKAVIVKHAEEIPSEFGKDLDKSEAFAAKKFHLTRVVADQASIDELKKRYADAAIEEWFNEAAAVGVKDPHAAYDFYRAKMAEIAGQS